MSTARKIIRRGFTLIETVTTVGIMAVLAAVVIPQVVRQFDTADPTRIQNDLKALQTAIETFHVNLRSQYPGDLDDLANPLSIAADSGLGATPTTYLPTETTAWMGPYVDFSLTELSAGATKVTGYGATIHDNFVCYNATDNTAGAVVAGAGPGCDAATLGATDRIFLAVAIAGLVTGTAGSFETLNDRFDGNGEGIGRDINGRVRRIAANNLVYYLAVPLN
jgi:prepilin-type N-terminal cleavage/methylation domain-containing protein